MNQRDPRTLKLALLKYTIRATFFMSSAGALVYGVDGDSRALLFVPLIALAMVIKLQDPWPVALPAVRSIPQLLSYPKRLVAVWVVALPIGTGLTFASAFLLAGVSALAAAAM